MEEHFKMSVKEINRLPVIKRLAAKEIRVKTAAGTLGLSVRQILRIKKRYVKEGVSGLVHQSRGRAGNRKIPEKEITRIMDIMKTTYQDFGPTLAHEKLRENHGVQLSRETLRRAMIGTNLWKPKRKHLFKVFQMRVRRSRYGELVQADGSPHAWFENRGEECTLLVFIDDATGKLMHLQFVERETLNAYFQAMYAYITKYGRPHALYVDKHSIFKTTRFASGIRSIDDSLNETQFTRAMRELAIEVICANTPQAKGRVEKVNCTLQDRLVKEMRLLGIKNMAEGNRFLPAFMTKFNQRFSVIPKEKENAHRPVLVSENLQEILIKKEVRILSKNLTFQKDNQLFQVDEKRPAYALRHAPVEIRTDWDNQMTVYYKGKKLSCQTFEKHPETKAVNGKELTEMLRHVTKRPVVIPAENHPWRRFVISY